MEVPGPLFHQYPSNPEFLFQQDCLELKPTKTAGIERTAVFWLFDVCCGIVMALYYIFPAPGFCQKRLPAPTFKLVCKAHGKRNSS